jgi:GNAT superfamily N-acetyltransferase
MRMHEYADSDWQEVAALFNRVYRDRSRLLVKRVAQGLLRQRLQQMVGEASHSRAFVASAGGEIGGFVSAHVMDADQGVITAPACADSIGSTAEALLSAAEGFLRDHGIRSAQIGGLTREHGVGFGEPMHMWLLNRGYRVVGEHDPEVVMELDVGAFSTPPLVQEFRRRNEDEGLVFEFVREEHIASLRELTWADWMQTGFSRHLADQPDRYPYAVCRDGDIVVGFCGDCWGDPETKGGGWAFILLRGWTPERDGRYFRRGIGAVLLAMADEWLRDHGAEYQILATGHGNPAQRLYRSAGYRYCMVTAPQLQKQLAADR